jgi:DNA invertase Pin-like site-specific DNA recombinase
MNREQHQKVTPRHLKRGALLYVRQSTMRQVFENTESTKRQYALRDRAVALGWPRDEIVVVDGDLGHTATAAGDREGFERVVTEVGMGRVGIVLGLEVSRLARNSSDWHRLLEICALADTLILDEDGVYNPKEFNDRLLLGLKGQMSEAEIYVMKARLHGAASSARPCAASCRCRRAWCTTRSSACNWILTPRCKRRSTCYSRPLTGRDPPRPR